MSTTIYGTKRRSIWVAVAVAAGIAVVVVGLAVFLSTRETAAHKQAREQAKVQAGIECTMEGYAQYTPTFQNCQDQRAADIVSAWEAAHPGQ